MLAVWPHLRLFNLSVWPIMIVITVRWPICIQIPVQLNLTAHHLHCISTKSAPPLSATPVRPVWVGTQEAEPKEAPSVFSRSPAGARLLHLHLNSQREHAPAIAQTSREIGAVRRRPGRTVNLRQHYHSVPAEGMELVRQGRWKWKRQRDSEGCM